MNPSRLDELIEKKMQSEGIASPTIRAFLHAVHCVIGGDQGLMPETSITPADQLTRLQDLSPKGDEALFNQLAVIKLNGGLGTGMGLDRAKSLLPVKGDDTFLDFIARQILALRRQRNSKQPA